MGGPYKGLSIEVAAGVRGGVGGGKHCFSIIMYEFCNFVGVMLFTQQVFHLELMFVLYFYFGLNLSLVLLIKLRFSHLKMKK